MNPIFQKERLSKLLKQTHVRNIEKNSQNNIASIEEYKPSQKELIV